VLRIYREKELALHALHESGEALWNSIKKKNPHLTDREIEIKVVDKLLSKCLPRSSFIHCLHMSGYVIDWESGRAVYNY
jgi:hypothetical protein